MHGPLWTPQIKGVEVCGCPSEEERERDHARRLHDDLAAMEATLHEIKPDGHRP